MFKDERKRKEAQEILKLAGALECVDDDVSDLCLKLMPKNDEHCISMAELMEGVQKIKNTLIQNYKNGGIKDES